MIFQKINKVVGSISVVLFLLLMTNCSKQLDKVGPKDAIPRESISESDIPTLMNGLYSGLEDFIFGQWVDGDYRAGLYRRGPGNTISADPVYLDPSDIDIRNIWSSTYVLINKVNFVLSLIEDSSDSGTLYANAKGELLYMRAYLYYHLVRRWGGVPLLTTNTTERVPRSPEDEIWDQIKDDLLAAEGLVSAEKATFYISKNAVRALLATIYLVTEDEPNALKYCDKILDQEAYVLASSSLQYSDLWAAGGKNEEIIFALANNNSNNQHPFYEEFNDVDNSWVQAPGLDYYQHLYDDKGYAKKDIRKEAVFSPDDDRRIIKFPNTAGWGLAPTANANYTPMVISRISEIYLIKAEALGHASDAAQDIQPYFEARYENAPTVSELSNLTDQEFEDLLLDERLREFYAEGYRWFDVKRKNRTDLLPNFNNRDFLLYYPIPETELKLGGYEPNPGY